MPKAKFSFLCSILILVGLLSFSAESSDFAAENEYFNTKVCVILFAIQASNKAGKHKGKLMGVMTKTSAELARNELAKSISVSKRLELDSLADSHVLDYILASKSDTLEDLSTVYKKLFYDADCINVIESTTKYLLKTKPSAFFDSSESLNEETVRSVFNILVEEFIEDIAFTPIETLETEPFKPE